MSIFSTLGDKIEAGLNKIGLELVSEWRHWYKLYSVWVFALMGVAPDLYNLAIQTGYLASAITPPALTHILNAIAFFGAASRLVKQKHLEVLQQSASDAQQEQSAEAAVAELTNTLTGGTIATPPAAPPVSAAPQTPDQPAAGTPPPAK